MRADTVAFGSDDEPWLQAVMPISNTAKALPMPVRACQATILDTLIGILLSEGRPEQKQSRSIGYGEPSRLLIRVAEQC
jgi:hypothetical protein